MKKFEVGNEMLDVQGRNGSWDCDPYMHGLYNGMEFMLSLIEEREPKFREAPKKWLSESKFKTLLRKWFGVPKYKVSSIAPNVNGNRRIK